MINLNDESPAQYWARHFSGLHADPMLDQGGKVGFSNDRVLFQYYCLALEGAGPFANAHCLDAGCGLGNLARLLASLGARVSACDVVQPTIAQLTQIYPQINWFVADIENMPELGTKDPYDLVFACEVLQHVNFAKAIFSLWRQVASGGRLIGIVPYADCPHVQRVQTRFPGRYMGVSLAEIGNVGAQLTGLGKWFWRGAHFHVDQTIAPYGLTPWSSAHERVDENIPNRIQFVFIRQV